MVMDEEFSQEDLLVMLQEFGQDVFNESQARCPEDTGWLKESGDIIMNATGFEIVYNAPHARLIHDGKEVAEQIYKQKVQRHRRRKRGSTSPVALNIDTKVTGVGSGNPNRMKRPRQGSYSDLKKMANIKRKSNTVSVRAHTKTYYGRRPMLNPKTGEWKVVNTTARQPTPFIDDAYRKVLASRKYRDLRKLGLPSSMKRGRQDVLRRFL